MERARRGLSAASKILREGRRKKQKSMGGKKHEAGFGSAVSELFFVVLCDSTNSVISLILCGFDRNEEDN